MSNRIKKLRIENCYTQDYVAKYIGISRPLYSLYESNKRKMNINHLIKLSRLYNTSIDYLVNETNQKEPHKKNLDMI